MHTENAIFIRGHIDNIFEIAANIERWPHILPHYRQVTVFDQSRDGRRKEVEMCAVRTDFPMPGANFPVKWQSVQLCDPREHKIIFKHTKGIARGMWVEWNLKTDPWGRGIRVSIAHDLRYPITAMNGWFSNEVVGKGFVESIAGKTLATIRMIVEEEHPAGQNAGNART